MLLGNLIIWPIICLTVYRQNTVWNLAPRRELDPLVLIFQTSPSSNFGEIGASPLIRADFVKPTTQLNLNLT